MAMRNEKKPLHRSGITVAWAVIVMLGLLSIASLAVDLGRVQLAKTQLRSAVDASGRAAGITLIEGGSTNSIRSAAKAVASANLIDGTGLTLQNSDIELGRWSNGTFTVQSSNRNAVRITGRRVASRDTAIPTIFAAFLGRATCDVTASVTAWAQAEVDVDETVSADCNPWLAGMPNNTWANQNNPADNPDRAPAQSPEQLTGVTLEAGMALTFDGISGTGQNNPSGGGYGPDGNSSWIEQNFTGAEHGMSNLRAPINSLVGVFLTDSQPNQSSAPSQMLDFSSASSRDFTTLSPQLKQPFFIGDGETSSGVKQQFIVPVGATRLFLANMDGYEWNNNSGSRTVSITKAARVQVVE